MFLLHRRISYRCDRYRWVGGDARTHNLLLLHVRNSRHLCLSLPFSVLQRCTCYTSWCRLPKPNMCSSRHYSFGISKCSPAKQNKHKNEYLHFVEVYRGTCITTFLHSTTLSLPLCQVRLTKLMINNTFWVTDSVGGVGEDEINK